LLARSLRDQDRDDMAALCERTGTLEICRAALLETNRMFPANELKRLIDTLPERDHPERRRTVPSADARHGDIARADLAALPGWSHRIRYVWQHAMPAPDYMLRRYGSHTRAALPWLYLRRWGSGLRKLFRTRYPDDRRQPDRSS